MMRWTLAATVTFLLTCGVAHGAPVGGSVADAEGDSLRGPGTDMVHAGWMFDAAAGTLGVTVTFAAAPNSEDWGRIRVALWGPPNAADEDCKSGTVFATLMADGHTARATAGAGTSFDGPQPDGSLGPTYVPAANTKSDDGRTTTLAVTHPRLVGRSARCLGVEITRNALLDEATAPVDGEPLPGGGGGDPGRPGEPGGDGPAPGPAYKPLPPPALRLASARPLAFVGGAAAVRLAGAVAGMHGTVSLRLRNGRTIARARFRAGSSARLTVRLRATTAGRGWLRRHRRGTGTLVISSSLDTARRTQRIAVTFRRVQR